MIGFYVEDFSLVEREPGGKTKKVIIAKRSVDGIRASCELLSQTGRKIDPNNVLNGLAKDFIVGLPPFEKR